MAKIISKGYLCRFIVRIYKKFIVLSSKSHKMHNNYVKKLILLEYIIRIQLFWQAEAACDSSKDVMTSL